MLLNKVQVSFPELGDTRFPAPVQRVPFADTAAAPNACRFRDPAAVFSASELNQQDRAKFRRISYFKIYFSVMHFLI
jgi:hypothetical protein